MKISWTLFIALPFLLEACAAGGSATANGNGATAIGGDGVNITNVSPSIALGDKVAEAASQAITQFYLRVPSPTLEQKAALENQAVSDGLKKSAELGMKPSAQQEAELRKEVKKVIK